MKALLTRAGFFQSLMARGTGKPLRTFLAGIADGHSLVQLVPAAVLESMQDFVTQPGQRLPVVAELADSHHHLASRFLSSVLAQTEDLRQCWLDFLENDVLPIVKETLQQAEVLQMDHFSDNEKQEWQKTMVDHGLCWPTPPLYVCVSSFLFFSLALPLSRLPEKTRKAREYPEKSGMLGRLCTRIQPPVFSLTTANFPSGTRSRKLGSTTVMVAWPNQMRQKHVDLI